LSTTNESWETQSLPVLQRSYDDSGNSLGVNPLMEARRQELEMLKTWVK